MVSSDALIAQRTDTIRSWFKQHPEVFWYVLLGILALFAFTIRTSNVENLKDITTNDWTLGPDLDPFLFVRWATEIVETGSLASLDTMRSVPLGFQTTGELLGITYGIVYFHKLLAFLGLSSSVTYSAILFPAFLFFLTLIVFFFLIREATKDHFTPFLSHLTALVSTFFLSVIPVLVPRTVAGIPEKEAGGFLLLFLALLFFIRSWNVSSFTKQYGYALLAGISSALMSYTWGGSAYIFYTVGGTIFVTFLLGALTPQRRNAALIWLLVGTFGILPFTSRFSFIDTLSSTSFLIAAFGIFGSYAADYCTKHTTLIPPQLKRLTPELQVLALCIGLGVLALIIDFLLLSNTSFLTDRLYQIYKVLIAPVSDRLNVTVAENRQPFFTEWVGNFGPYLKNIPLFFWLGMFGFGAYLLSTARTYVTRTKVMFVASFLFLVLALALSRYDASSMFNGTNTISLLMSGAGFLGVLYAGYDLYKREQFSSLASIPSSFWILFIFFLLSIISARGAVRLVMVLAPALAFFGAFGLVWMGEKAHRAGIQSLITFGALLIILAGGWTGLVLFQQTQATAQGYIPSEYTHQWQEAMSWVRENTPASAVFGHWWDYGYWVQSIGKRATPLDGGNIFPYWNHLMGRYALTGTSSKEAAEFLCTHKVTHFLIDPTDIGKYGAYASIGSNHEYDRRSFIPTFFRDPAQQKETKNGTIFLYTIGGGIPLDQDIVYNLNGTELFLPEGGAGIVGFKVEFTKEGTIAKQPFAVIIYQGKQYELPLKYAAQANSPSSSFSSGVDAGIFIYPRLQAQNNNAGMDPKGTLLYLSPRVVHSRVAELYLFGKEDAYFTLVHAQDDRIISFIKQQNQNLSLSFVQDDVYPGARGNSFAGPIKIWKVSCNGVQTNSAFLETVYPQDLVQS